MLARSSRLEQEQVGQVSDELEEERRRDHQVGQREYVQADVEQEEMRQSGDEERGGDQRQHEQRAQVDEYEEADEHDALDRQNGHRRHTRGDLVQLLEVDEDGRVDEHVLLVEGVLVARQLLDRVHEAHVVERAAERRVLEEDARAGDLERVVVVVCAHVEVHIVHVLRLLFGLAHVVVKASATNSIVCCFVVVVAAAAAAAPLGVHCVARSHVHECVVEPAELHARHARQVAYVGAERVEARLRLALVVVVGLEHGEYDDGSEVEEGVVEEHVLAQVGVARHQLADRYVRRRVVHAHERVEEQVGREHYEHKVALEQIESALGAVDAFGRRFDDRSRRLLGRRCSLSF